MEKKKKVLIVEDETAIREAIAQSLIDSEIDVITAADGQIGLDLALENHPDLIITDIIMPKLHGMELYSQIRDDQWGKNVNIIILTNILNNTNAIKATKNSKTELMIKNNIKLNEFILFIKKKLQNI